MTLLKKRVVFAHEAVVRVKWRNDFKEKKNCFNCVKSPKKPAP